MSILLYENHTFTNELLDVFKNARFDASSEGTNALNKFNELFPKWLKVAAGDKPTKYSICAGILNFMEYTQYYPIKLDIHTGPLIYLRGSNNNQHIEIATIDFDDHTISYDFDHFEPRKFSSVLNFKVENESEFKQLSHDFEKARPSCGIYTDKDLTREKVHGSCICFRIVDMQYVSEKNTVLVRVTWEDSNMGEHAREQLMDRKTHELKAIPENAYNNNPLTDTNGWITYPRFQVVS